MTYTLTLIARNEAANLPLCLGCAAGLFSEILVLDTGSTDPTPEVARSLGARVFDFPWPDSFATARNESIRHATGDWIFWLDADDRIDEANLDKLRRLLENLRDEKAAYVMTTRSTGPAGSSGMRVQQVRLFRNLPEIRWEYRVHEQIIPSLRRAGHELRWTDIVIEHTGYRDPALRAQKQERNLRLLHLDQADRPDDPFTLFNLGLAYLDLGRPSEAIPFLHASLERLPPGASIVPRAYAALVRAYLGARNVQGRTRALEVCAQARSHCPQDAELLFLAGCLCREAGDRPGAAAAWREMLTAEQKPPKIGLAEKGTLEGQAPQFESQFIDVDESLFSQARQNLAGLYREEARYPEAEELWKQVLAEDQGSSRAWHGLAEIYLAQSRWDEMETALAELEKRLPAGESGTQSAPMVAVLRARGLLARKEYRSARVLLEQVISQNPRAVPPRVFLTHVLLQEGTDPAAAERALRDLLAIDPAQGESWRNLAVLLRSQNRVREALAICDSGRVSCPGDLELMLFHGLLLQEIGDLANAEKAFRDVVSGAPGPSQQRGSSLVLTARHNLALILRRQERLREAEAQWRSALADAADFWPAWLGLGELCVMEKRFAEAEGILQRLEGGRNGHVMVGHGQAPDGQAVELPAALLRARLYLARRDFLAAKVHLQGLIGRRMEGGRRKAEG